MVWITFWRELFFFAWLAVKMKQKLHHWKSPCLSPASTTSLLLLSMAPLPDKHSPLDRNLSQSCLRHHCSNRLQTKTQSNSTKCHTERHQGYLNWSFPPDGTAGYLQDASD